VYGLAGAAQNAAAHTAVGPLLLRPPASLQSRNYFYYASDTDQLFVCDGKQWVPAPINPKGLIPASQLGSGQSNSNPALVLHGDGSWASAIPLPLPTSMGGTGATSFPASTPPSGWVFKLNTAWISTTDIYVLPGNCADSTAAASLTLSSRQDVSITSFDVALGLVRNALVGTVATNSASKNVTGTGTQFTGAAFQTRALSGTISASASTTVTGSNTLFLSQVAVNDLIGTVAGGWTRVTAIASDTSLTISTSSTFSGAASVMEQPLLQPASQSTRQVDIVTDDTHLTLTANASGTNSGIGATAGAFPQFAAGVGAFYFYVYICNGGSGTTAILSSQRTVPWLPTGYTTYYRRLGAVCLDSSGNILAFTSTGANSSKVISYQTAINTYSSRLVTNGTATSWTALAGNVLAPPTSDKLIVSINQAAPTNTTNAYIRPRNIGESATSRNIYGRCNASSNTASTLLADCDGAQFIDYVNSAASGATNVDLAGYEDQL
jgi:hypothetical protein